MDRTAKERSKKRFIQSVLPPGKDIAVRIQNGDDGPVHRLELLGFGLIVRECEQIEVRVRGVQVEVVDELSDQNQGGRLGNPFSRMNAGVDEHVRSLQVALFSYLSN